MPALETYLKVAARKEGGREGEAGVWGEDERSSSNNNALKAAKKRGGEGEGRWMESASEGS